MTDRIAEIRAMRDAVVGILVEDECDELIGSVRMPPLPEPESEVG